MQATPTSAAATRKVFEVLLAVKTGVEVAAEVDAVPLAMDATVKTVPATADGAASAPMTFLFRKGIIIQRRILPSIS